MSKATATIPLAAFSQLPPDIILSTLSRLRAVSPIAPLVESPRGASPRCHNRPWELSPRNASASPTVSPRECQGIPPSSRTVHNFAVPHARHAVEQEQQGEAAPAASKASTALQQQLNSAAYAGLVQLPMYLPGPYQHLLQSYATNTPAANYVSQALLLQAAAQLNSLSAAVSPSTATNDETHGACGKRKRSSSSSSRSKRALKAAAVASELPMSPEPSSAERAEDEDEDSKKKRANPEQVQLLEEVFLREPLPSRRTKEQLATRLGLSHRRVQVWFQNRRAKERPRDLRNRGINDAEVLPNPWAK